MQRINKYLLIVVLLLIMAVCSVSVAYFGAKVLNDNINPTEVKTGNLDLHISDVKIYSDKIIPIYDKDYESRAYKKEFVVSNAEESLNSCTSIYLNIDNMSESLKNPYFKYKLLSNNIELSEGDFSNVESNKILLKNVYLKSGEYNIYTLYLWISYDENIDQLSMLNSSITANILVKGYDMKEESACSNID